ncbi:MAG: PAS domain S-box protein [Acidobacteriia bacterium]|nr:PAS domain S-box protein [Terriglobia bacterium]
MNGGNVTEPRAAGQERGCVEGALCRDERRFQSSAAEEPSAESEERFQELADAMVQIVWIADASGALEYGNQRAYEYAGVRPGDLDGWKWTAQVHPDDLAATTAAWKQAIQSGAAYEVAQRLRRFDGEFRWHLTRGAPVCNRQGQVIRWVGTATDIHDHKLAEEALRQTQRELAERVRERTAESRRHADYYASMLAASTDGFWLVDAEGRVLDVNDAACRMSGYSRAELLTMRIPALEADERPEEVAAHIRRVAESGFGRFERRNRTKSGRIIDVEISVCLSRATGQLLVFTRDITRLKQTQAELCRHRDQLEMLVAKRTIELEAANAHLLQEIAERRLAQEAIRKSRNMLSRAQRVAKTGSWEWDIRSGDLTWSDQVYHGFCLDPGVEPNYETFLSLVHADDRSRIRAAVEEALAGQPYELEYRISLPDGSIRHFLAQTDVDFDEQGKPVRITGTTMDITDRKQAEERLRQSQKLESIGLLAAGVAHDFNNLLLGIIGNASLAREQLPPDHPAAELLAGIIGIGEQAATLTRQMLAYSGKGQFLVEPVILSELVPQISGLLEPSISRKIELRFDLSPDLPAFEADRSQIQQIYMNLLFNAAEAIGGGSGLITVRTGVQEMDGRACVWDIVGQELRAGRYVFLEVDDNGCGMNDATRARIFDPFFSTKFTGRGLGLAAVAGIVRAHRGAIRVASAPGKGSRFTALFPLAEANVSGAVLIVDDEAVVRRVARQGLEQRGYRTMVTESGPAAIDLLENNAVELVVLDVSTPGPGGEDALSELRRYRPDVRFVISSGYSEAEARKLFRGRRVSGFIQKPYTSAQLADKVREAMNGREEPGDKNQEGPRPPVS